MNRHPSFSAGTPSVKRTQTPRSWRRQPEQLPVTHWEQVKFAPLIIHAQVSVSELFQPLNLNCTRKKIDYEQYF